MRKQYAPQSRIEVKPISQTSIGRWYKWVLVIMLWFICFFNYADRQAIFSVFPLLKTELKLSGAELGLLGSAFMWVYAFSAPFAGYVGDRLKRKAVILGGLYIWSAITYLTALSTKLWHLVTFRAMEGFGESFYFPASMSMIGDYHGKATRSRAMSIHQSSVYIGTIGGGALAGFLGERYGWRSSFYVFGALGVLLGLVLMKFIREPKRGEAEAEELRRAEAESAHELKRVSAPAPQELPQSGILQVANPGGETTVKKISIREFISEIFRIPTAFILMGVFFGANFVAMVFLTWMPSFLYEKFQMSLTVSGVTATVFIQTASMIGVLFGGWMADFLSKRRPGGRMMTQACGLFLGAPFIFLTGWTLSVPFLIFAMTGFGFFKGMYDSNIFASLFDVIKPEMRATASGVMNTIGWIGGGIAPLAIGVATPAIGMSTAIASTSIVYLLIASLMVFGIVVFVRKDITKFRMAMRQQQVEVA